MKEFFIENRPLVFGATALILLGAVFLLIPRHTAPHFSPLEYAKAKAFWSSEIHTLGAASAYKEFVSSGSGEDSDSAHITAHAMGAALFEELGDAGLSQCDASFGFGCYHGFFLSALGVEGESRVAALYDVCVKAYGILGTGCQHGIGHGIMEYVGYDNVSRALDLCSTLAPQVAPLLGCTDGVFMEYFWPLGTEGVPVPTTRPLNVKDAYAPCPSVAPQFQRSCYFEEGTRFYWNPDTDYVGLCSALSGDARVYCIVGVGSALMEDERSVSSALDACASFKGADDRLSCRAGAAWTLFSNGRKDEVRAACAYDDPQDSASCLTLADFTLGRDPTFPKPQP